MGEVIPNWLEKRVSLTPNRVAVIEGERSWTFKEMRQEVLRWSRKLSPFIQEGSRVAILLKNNSETIWIIHALQQLRAETVFLNHRLSANEIIFQLKDSGCSTLLIDGEASLREHIKEESVDITIIEKNEQLTCEEKELCISKEFQLDDICSIMYTSGTTGKPKAVAQSYGNHWWSAIGSALNLGLHEKDAWLCAVPLFHISGLSIMMRSVIYGIPMMVVEHFEVQKVNEILKSGTITIMSVVSTMLHRMLEEIEEGTYHPHFRCMLLGGGPAPKPLLETCMDKQIPVFQTYGMTETASQIVTLSPEDSIRKLGSAGKPLFPSQVKIMLRIGEEASRNEIGEITVKGPNVTSGYLNRAEENEKLFQDGWFSTGDLGYFDEEGFLYVVDRRSDLIISGGENIYPAEIESVILSHPAIKEVGVTGVSHSQWGMVPYAFFVTEQEITGEELAMYCQQYLARYKVPKQFIQVDHIPKNASNKIVRRHLLQFLPDGKSHDED